MSEQLSNNNEHAEALLPTGEIEKLLEAQTEHRPNELQAEALKQQTAIAEAREAAKTVEHDDPLARLQASETESANHAPAPPPNKFLQKVSLKRELDSIRRKESVPERALSRIVHQPAVRAVSEAAGKTISRPSGLLGGGIVAFLGSSAYLYLAYHIGFTYRPTVFTVMLVAGFIVGLILEFFIRLVTKSKQSS